MDGSRHKVFVVNVNWNSDNRKWNVNDWKLDENGNWNTDNQVLCPGNAYCFSHLFGGSFDSNPFFHPPSIRPISWSLRIAYGDEKTDASEYMRKRKKKRNSTVILGVTFTWE